jgi:hypothetical protein
MTADHWRKPEAKYAPGLADLRGRGRGDAGLPVCRVTVRTRSASRTPSLSSTRSTCPVRVSSSPGQTWPLKRTAKRRMLSGPTQREVVPEDAGMAVRPDPRIGCAARTGIGATAPHGTTPRRPGTGDTGASSLHRCAPGAARLTGATGERGKPSARTVLHWARPASMAAIPARALPSRGARARLAVRDQRVPCRRQSPAVTSKVPNSLRSSATAWTHSRPTCAAGE